MSLPVRLKPGQASIYGPGSSTGTTGIKAPDGYVFGIVDQVWDNGLTGYKVGDSVLFKGEDIVPLIYSNWPYLLIDEQKILTVEVIGI